MTDDEKPEKSLSVGEAWQNFKGMLLRDFAWVVCVLILFLLLLLAVSKAADKENACHELYEPFVRTCYESHGFLPNGAGFNYSWNLSLDNRNSGDRWQSTPAERFE